MTDDAGYAWAHHVCMGCDVVRVWHRCAHGLAVPAGVNWKEFLTKLNSKFAKCKVLIVCLTRGFYLSV